MKKIHKRIIEWIWIIIYPIILYLLLDYLKFGNWGEVFQNFSVKIPVPQYIIVPYLIYLSINLIFRGIFKTNFISNCVTTILFTIISIVSYYKYKALSLPFIPQDLTLIGNVGEIAQFGVTSVPLTLIISVLILALVLALNYLIEKKLEPEKFHPITRIAMIFVGLLAVIVMCIPASRYENLDIAPKDGDNYIWTTPSTVFFLHIGDFFVKAPENYNEETISYLEEKYSEEKKESTTDNPNVIFIMNESFADPTKFTNVNYSKNPMEDLENLDAIKGEISTPVFGGGTAFPEFEALTGLSAYYMNLQIFPHTSYIRSDMNSNVRIFNENGYITTGIHTFKKSFYNRYRVYDYLGFKNTVFSEDIENPEYSGDYIADNEIANQIIKQFNSTDEKQFIFAVTMQNHMHYKGRVYDYYDIEVNANTLSESEIDELKNYVQGVYDGVQMYMRLVTMLKQSDKPTILVMFGDHLPTIGDNISTYKKMGMNIAGEELYRTPYIIWSNYELDINVPKVMSPANLGVQILEMANLDVPWYINAFRELYEMEPALNPLFTNVNNKLVNECEIIQFDLLMRKKYIEIR